MKISIPFLRRLTDSALNERAETERRRNETEAAQSRALLEELVQAEWRRAEETIQKIPGMLQEAARAGRNHCRVYGIHSVCVPSWKFKMKSNGKIIPPRDLPEYVLRVYRYCE